MFSLEHLNALRMVEIDKIARHFPPGARVLEVGAGTGQQSLALAERGFNVEAIEIADSNYAQARLSRITNYDGRYIPFPAATFDVVFSSNVLEHVPDLQQMHKEIKRVLKPGGSAIHVMPTHSWRFWTLLASVPASVQRAALSRPRVVPPRRLDTKSWQAFLRGWYYTARHIAGPLVQRRHGERGNCISETWLFRPSWWRRNFRENGFEVVLDEPMGLFYTGHMVFAQRWSFARREKAAKSFGSACHLFKVSPTSEPA